VSAAARAVRLQARARHALKDHGVRGTAERVLGMVRPIPRRTSSHVWYAMDLRGERPHPALDGDLVLRRGTAADLWLLEQLPIDARVTPMRQFVVEDRLANGGSLWLVHEGDRAAFCCWVFRDWFPMGAARGGGIAPPAGAVVLEDSHSSPDFRGRGVAPAAWAAIADAHRDEGADRMYTKVGVDNAASRRAVEKAGFREVARMLTIQRYWWLRIRVRGAAEVPAHGWLSQLDRG
jgi:GNAT superfamily N-acetyltransferase